MQPLHWYHIWCGNEERVSAWLQAAQEHFTALHGAKFEGKVSVGIVGESGRRREIVKNWLDSAWPDWELCDEADDGFEMVTLECVHAMSRLVDPATPVLYTHTKGAYNNEYGNHRWRKAMTELLVTDWRECVEQLKGHDVVAPHWLTPQEFPERIFRQGMAGGNFWWATAGYIAGLPPLEYESRYCAEGWIGRDVPKVKDLKPGWPAYW